MKKKSLNKFQIKKSTISNLENIRGGQQKAVKTSNGCGGSFYGDCRTVVGC